MISHAAFEKNGQAWCEKNPVGTGPFQFVSWQKDVAIKFKRFDGYWGGKPYLDGVEMAKVPDPVANLMMFKTGGKHIILLEPKMQRTSKRKGSATSLFPLKGRSPPSPATAKTPSHPLPT